MAPITITIDKKSGRDLGATFQVDNGCIILSKIRRGSCLHKSNLHEGYEIISVNGLPCYGLSIDQVEDLFTDSIDIITIIADDPMDTQRRRLVLEL